jgi:hypothetical protein
MSSIEASKKLRPKPGGVKQLSLSSLKSHSQHRIGANSNNQTSLEGQSAVRDETGSTVTNEREKDLRMKKMSTEVETDKIKHVKMFRNEVYNIF